MTPVESALAIGWVLAVAFFGLWRLDRAELKATRAYAKGLRGLLCEELSEGAEVADAAHDETSAEVSS